MTDLHFSIDLEAELEKITQRQSLNAVHYLVQLVRKALQEQPTRIEIRIKWRFLEFQHDGTSLAQEEMTAIASLLNQHGQQTSEQHRTLALLEHRYGIALLTILLRFNDVTLYSAQQKLTKKGALRTLVQHDEAVPGFRLVIRGKGRNPKEEQREVAFFCAGANTPLFVNGVQINQPITLSPCLMKKSYTIATKKYRGQGEIGIPSQGEYSEFWFYKHGVRAAMKQFTTQSGNIVHGWWNLESTHQEANFEYTIETGERHLFEKTETLYYRTFESFDALPDTAKYRIRKMIFQWSPVEWFVDLLDLPVFHSSRGLWTLRLRDLIALHKRYFAIPYIAPGLPVMEPEYPILDLDEVNFLTIHLRLSIRRLQRENAAQPAVAREPSNALAAEDLSPQALALIKALDRADPICLHGFHRGDRVLIKGNRLLFPLTHPLIQQMLEQQVDSSSAVLLWKYRTLSKLEKGY